MSARAVRRAAVLAVVAICCLLVSSLPASLHGTGIVLVLVLAGLDVALVSATGGLAYTRARSLDERQAALRDLAYRRGFRLLGLGLIVAFVLTYVTLVIAVSSQAHVPPVQVGNGLGGRALVAIAELLVMMPTLVIAWTEPDRTPHDDLAVTGRRPLAALALVVPALLAAWLLALTFAPAQAAAPNGRVGVAAQPPPGSTCRHFATGSVVGAQFGATVGLRAHVCWNGRLAFVIGDPSVPPPPGSGAVAFPDPYLTACGADNGDDFAVVADTACTATTDADGTLRYTVRARVLPLPFSIAAREVTARLVVTRDGRVLERP